MSRLKVVTVFAAVFAICGFANAAPPSQKLVCPMKDHNGQSSFTAEITLDEPNSKVSMGALELPAVYTPAAVTWQIDTAKGPPGGFNQRLDRYSGELVVSFINPTTGSRLVPHSGVCQPAAEVKRRF